MTRREKDIMIADFTGTKMLSKVEYAELVGCPDYELDNMPEYFPTFYDWKRIMPVAEGLVNGYYDDFDLDDLMSAGGRFDLKEIFDAVVDAIQTIKNNE